jgi:ribose 5-phosphate isomerase RpiB
LVARDLLHGTAATYGIMLGATGVGAVIGALMMSTLRARFSAEAAVRYSPSGRLSRWPSLG